MILRCFSFLLGGGRTGVTLAGTGNESGINTSSCNKEGGIGRISSSDSSANGSIVASRAVEAVEMHEFLFSSSEKKKERCQYSIHKFQFHRYSMLKLKFQGYNRQFWLEVELVVVFTRIHIQKNTYLFSA